MLFLTLHFDLTSSLYVAGTPHLTCLTSWRPNIGNSPKAGRVTTTRMKSNSNPAGRYLSPLYRLMQGCLCASHYRHRVINRNLYDLELELMNKVYKGYDRGFLDHVCMSYGSDLEAIKTQTSSATQFKFTFYLNDIYFN